MALTGPAAWRSSALGEMRRLTLRDCSIRCYESGTGEPLVFLHGILTNANAWRKVIPTLAKDFRCIVLDLPLGAHNEPMPGADVSPTGIARMVAEAIAQLGLGRATLVANDTGGSIAQVVATQHAECVDGLVLTSCEFRDNCPPLLFKVIVPLSYVPGGLAMYLLPGQLRPLQRMPVAYGFLSKRPFDREAAITYVRPTLVSRAIRRDFARFLRDYNRRYTRDAADRLAGFDRPTLVAWSREDKVMPPRDGEELARIIPGARLEWIEDSYTLSPEDQPDRVAELVRAFARDQPEPRAVSA